MNSEKGWYFEITDLYFNYELGIWYWLPLGKFFILSDSVLHP